MSPEDQLNLILLKMKNSRRIKCNGCNPTPLLMNALFKSRWLISLSCSSLSSLTGREDSILSEVYIHNTYLDVCIMCNSEPMLVKKKLRCYSISYLSPLFLSIFLRQDFEMRHCHVTHVTSNLSQSFVHHLQRCRLLTTYYRTTSLSMLLFLSNHNQRI